MEVKKVFGVVAIGVAVAGYGIYRIAYLLNILF